ncbi:GNAT family N-acetyltransferase [Pseudorhodoplanes sp.]|uniref:GNAT family N-acetyltransferase n=1 Tax=Pseudorhodoplanes sp. TaxID=1934341 RepID=UPI00391BEDEF
MLIDVIDNLASFERARPEWDEVYGADPDAQFFLSWIWMAQWIPLLSGPWAILAARPHANAKYVAFFPLRWRLKEERSGFHNELSMMGNSAADYTGFICKPDYDTRAIAAIARYIKRLNWRRINLENVRTTEARLKALLSNFSDKRFDTRQLTRVNKSDNIDNCICPAVSLPGDWDSYLAARTSANMRQKVRRFLRQVESDPALRITHSHGEDVERDLKTLLDFWAVKWGARKGGRLSTIINSNYNLLRKCAQAGHLLMPVLWRGDKPVGALASFLDPQKRSVLFYMAGRDASFNDPPPGLVLHAHSIRYAIESGFTTYDFLRGNEPYKYSFGATERRIQCLVVNTRSERNLGDKLTAQSLPAVFSRCTELHKAGKLAQAARGYRQILDTDPTHAVALYCFGQLMTTEGKYGAAKRLFTELTKLQPKSEKAWTWLAKTLEAREHFAEAAKAYRSVIGINPKSTAAYTKLGAVLVKQRQFDEAVAAFDRAIQLDPDNLEAQVSRGNTLFMCGRLPEHLLEYYSARNAELGDKASASGETKFALQCYRQALAMKSDLAQAHYGLARILEATGDAGDALLSYRRAAEIDPKFRDVGERLAAMRTPPLAAIPTVYTAQA